MLISSRQNEKIKFIKSLFRKETRSAKRLFVVEGFKTVREAISHNIPITTLVITQKWQDKFDESIETLLVTDSVFESLSNEVSPEGVLAVVKMPDTSVIPPKSEKCLLLDGVSDPGIMGTIIRTATAAGYKDIYLRGCVEPFNPKVVRSSMSGIYFVNLHIGTFDEIKVALQGIPLIGADMDGTNVFDFKSPKAFCLAVGSESHGISPQTEELAQYKVSIPMEKEMESLNAGVSASILMYLLK